MRPMMDDEMDMDMDETAGPKKKGPGFKRLVKSLSGKKMKKGKKHMMPNMPPKGMGGC